MSNSPLSGVRVIDLTHAVAGPFATHHLQLMGAEVIKVEPQSGDDFRERAAPFAAVNAGKRSMTLDLKSEAGKALLYRMIADADVLIENYRPGAAAKLGVDWETVKAVNPKLIFCSISGFGQDGPMWSMPAIESSVQAASGLLAAQVGADEHPRKIPVLLLDPLTGYMAYAAILAALLQTQRTGVGQRIDVAMIDAALMISSVAIANPQFEAPPAPATIVGRPTVARFKAKDRALFIAAVLPAWFNKVCDVIGRPELKDDPRFSSNKARFENADALITEWEVGLAAKPAAEWEAELAAAGVPVGVVRSISEFSTHPQVEGRQALTTLKAPGAPGPVRLMGAGVRFANDGPAFQGDVPELGAHTDEVLAQFGLTAAEIADLRTKSVV